MTRHTHAQTRTRARAHTHTCAWQVQMCAPTNTNLQRTFNLIHTCFPQNAHTYRALASNTDVSTTFRSRTNTHTLAHEHGHSQPSRLRLQEALCTQLSPQQPVLISTIHLQIVMDRLLSAAHAATKTHTHTHTHTLSRKLASTIDRSILEHT